jgi:protein TonB
MMKPIYLTLFLTAFTSCAQAQKFDSGSNPYYAPDSSLVQANAMVDTAYPGGLKAWLRFLNKRLRYPDKAVNKNIMGTVWIQFTVNADSTVSDVAAVSGPTDGGLREEAARLVTVSGHWIPRTENGVPVTSIRRVPIVFKLM